MVNTFLGDSFCEVSNSTDMDEFALFNHLICLLDFNSVVKKFHSVFREIALVNDTF